MNITVNGMSKQKQNKYIVRKCVTASSPAQAIRKSRDAEVLEVTRVVVRGEEHTPAIGFDAEFCEDEFE